jgi:hypothetical protein
VRYWDDRSVLALIRSDYPFFLPTFKSYKQARGVLRGAGGGWRGVTTPFFLPTFKSYKQARWVGRARWKDWKRHGALLSYLVPARARSAMRPPPRRRRRCCSQVVQRSDAARWLILYKYGGVYIDNGALQRSIGGGLGAAGLRA